MSKIRVWAERVQVCVSSWSDRRLVRPAWALPGRSATVSPDEGRGSTKSLGVCWCWLFETSSGSYWKHWSSSSVTS